MDLPALIKMDKKEISRVSKIDLVSAISKDWQYENACKRADKAEENSSERLTESLLCKKLISSYLNKEYELDNYEKEPKWNDMPLISLVGELLGDVIKREI